MPYEQDAKPTMPHAVNLDNRARMSLSGVEDVSGFDENTVVLTTSLGELTIRGEALHIGRIDLDLGQLDLEGHISELCYDEPAARTSFFSRLFS